MDKALETMIQNMPEKTGKSLDEWKKILQIEKIEKHGEAVKYLKSEYGVTHGFANTIVALSKEDSHSETDLVAEQYKGKEDLFTIYENIKGIITDFGNDITITPKKGSVSFLRKRQFALIKPATKSRIDLGLKIKDQEPNGILESSGPFGAMCTHRIQISEPRDINDEVKKWIAEAYHKSI